MISKTFLSVVQRNIIVWTLVPGILFILMLGSWIVWNKVQDFKQNSEVLVSSTSRYVSSYVRDAQATLKTFSRKIDVSQTNDELKQSLASLSGLYPHFKRLIWLAPNKLVRAAHPTGIEGTDFPLIMREVSQNELMVSRPMPSLETGEVVMYHGFVTPTKDIIVAELDLESLKRHIDVLLSKDITIIVTDQNRNVVVHPDKELVRQQANLSGLTILQKSKNRELFHGFFKDKGYYFFGSVAHLPDTKWVMLVSQSASLILIPVIQTSALLFLILFLFSIFFLWRLRNSLRKLLIVPLDIFIEHIQITAKGDYKSSLNQSISFHELNVMQTEFQAMTNKLLKRENSLKRYGEELENMVQDRTEELTSIVSELQQRNEESIIMTRFGDFLQACETEQESYNMLISVCKQMYVQESGYLSIIDESSEHLTVVSSFGDFAKIDMEFEIHECWALRRGRPHVISDERKNPTCPHTGNSTIRGSICIPIDARGKSLGLLYIQLGVASENREKHFDRTLDAEVDLAKRIVERYSLSLHNIRLREKLRIQSIRDPLTRLYNRRYMEVSLQREINRARRKNLSLGVILLDVDHFKKFNDSYGHETGDKVLMKLGKFLINHTRGEDIACRYGGEELLIILPDCSPKDCFDRAEQIRVGVEAINMPHGDTKLSITISLGTATYPHNGNSVEEVVSAADTALYKAKEQGRNQVVLSEIE